MKGLLKNNFMGVMENIKILFPLSIILGIIVSVTGDASLLSIYSLSVTPILSILAVLCLRKETLSKWYKYKISLPETIENLILLFVTVSGFFRFGGCYLKKRVSAFT